MFCLCEPFAYRRLVILAAVFFLGEVAFGEKLIHGDRDYISYASRFDISDNRAFIFHYAAIFFSLMTIVCCCGCSLYRPYWLATAGLSVYFAMDPGVTLFLQILHILALVHRGARKRKPVVFLADSSDHDADSDKIREAEEPRPVLPVLPANEQSPARPLRRLRKTGSGVAIR
jgi:hypothetical protein